MPVLNDDKKLSNPRAGSVRIAADTMSGYSGQRRHDLRIGTVPKYVDEKRVHLNRVLIAPPTPAEMREIAQARRARRDTQRAMKSNAAVATAGIITFGSEAAQMFEALSQEDQDAAFRDLAEAVAAHLNTSLHALVVHLDEATIHAHFALCAYDDDGVPLSRATRPAILSELQDLTAEILQRYCPEIERATRYGDRLAAGAEWADVIHKTVKQLHRELPGDLAAKRAELEALEQVGVEAQDRIDGLRTELAKLDRTVERVSGDVAQLEDEKTRVEEELDDLIRDQEAAEVARDASDRIAKIAHRERKERQARAAAARAETRAVEDRLAGLMAAEAEARDRLAGLEEEEEAARKRVAQMQGRVDTLTEKASLTDKEAKRLETYRRRLKDRVAVLEAAKGAAQAARDAATAETESAQAEAARVTAEAEAKAKKAATEVRGAEARKAEIGKEIEDLTVDAVVMAQVVADRQAEAARLKTEAEEKARARDAAEADRVKAENAAKAAAEQTRIEAARATGLAQEIEDLTVGVVAMARVAADRKAEAVRLKADTEEQARARDAAAADRVKAEDAAKAAAEQTQKEEARAAETQDRIGVVTAGLGALVKEIAKGTISRDAEGRLQAQDIDLLEPAFPDIAPAVEMAVSAVKSANGLRSRARRLNDETLKTCEAAQAAINIERQTLEKDQAALRQDKDQLAKDQGQLKRDQNATKAQATRAQWMLSRLEPLLTRFVKWLKLPGMPKFIRDEGVEILGDTMAVFTDLKDDGLESRP
ncbi:plasmid recombination protein [Phaeobacter gallaeciensis]|uniref:plasmid recombination protein n=1 Tax=Phaeobacter gallaeciensis TaxID=60890 RepID=UPI00237F2F11|nr:plasmid recombination protein [Phaeobacter gallaeciensis]MDE4061916.1 plasmid recombination protein [Phaeobacter gallaeciensis]MDE4124896.1 plasmid recombination protein [Phaeobacter gallaeciensis]MDE4129368.1 plasmid recombination protein [Phaeobacter gallaeciensis]